MQRYFSGNQGFQLAFVGAEKEASIFVDVFGAAFLHETELIFPAPLYTNVLAQGHEIRAPKVEQIAAGNGFEIELFQVMEQGAEHFYAGDGLARLHAEAGGGRC